MVCLFIGGLTQFAAGLRCGSTPPNEHMVRWVLKVTRSIEFGAKECSHPCGAPPAHSQQARACSSWLLAARLLAQGPHSPPRACLGPPMGSSAWVALVGPAQPQHVQRSRGGAMPAPHAALHGAAGAKGHCPRHPQAH